MVEAGHGASRDVALLSAGVALGVAASWWLAAREKRQGRVPRPELKTIHVIGARGAPRGAARSAPRRVTHARRRAVRPPQATSTST